MPKYDYQKVYKLILKVGKDWKCEYSQTSCKWYTPTCFIYKNLHNDINYHCYSINEKLKIFMKTYGYGSLFYLKLINEKPEKIFLEPDAENTKRALKTMNEVFKNGWDL